MTDDLKVRISPLHFSHNNKLQARDNRTSGKVGNYFVHHCNKSAHCSLGKEDVWVPNLLINLAIPSCHQSALWISRFDQKQQNRCQF